MTETTPQWTPRGVDRQTLKRLVARDDRRGLLHFGGYFALLVALGATLVLTWTTLWAIPTLLIYSAVWSFANANGHEACHFTPFRSRRLNTLLLYISSWMVNWEPITVRWVHARHHEFTSIPAQDAEYLLPNPLNRRDLFDLLSGWNQVWHYNKEMLQLSFGYANEVIRLAVPATELAKVYRNARLYLGSYAGIVAAAIYWHSWLPVCLLLLPRVLGAPLHGILRITQHGGLATAVRDHRKTTRTMYINPLLQLLYCNMNYHIEHHLYPMLPFYALPRLHAAIKPQLPPPSDGVFGALREVLLTRQRQRHAPSYDWSQSHQLTSNQLASNQATSNPSTST